MIVETTFFLRRAYAYTINPNPLAFSAHCCPKLDNGLSEMGLHVSKSPCLCTGNVGVAYDGGIVLASCFCAVPVLLGTQKSIELSL